MVLTRDSIRSGAVHRLIADLGIEMRVLSEAELGASLGATLAGVDLSAGVWLFGYGSLIWNPAFHFSDRLAGRIYGYHRRFCLWTHLGRGCPERPGLVLGLERGGSCQGVAFHIAPRRGPGGADDRVAARDAERRLSAALGRGAHRPRPAAGDRLRDQPAHERYASVLADEEVAVAIATASGFLGACADYLVNTVDHLAELGIHDRPLERLRQQVVAIRAAEPFSA